MDGSPPEPCDIGWESTAAEAASGSSVSGSQAAASGRPAENPQLLRLKGLRAYFGPMTTPSG